MLDNLKVFVVCVQAGSLSRAAEQVDMTVATVSRRLDILEDTLGCQLLNRSPRGVSLTPRGEIYYTECAELIAALDQRLFNLDRTLNSLAGPLKVLAPTNLACGVLAPFWRDFIQRYPEIQLTLNVSNFREDMIASRADLAIRVGPQPDSGLRQKKLGHTTTLLVAAASKTDLPLDLTDLEQCPSIASNLIQQWHLTSDCGEIVKLNKQHQHISDDLNVVMNLVQAGAGIAMLPSSMVYQLLEEGELQQVMSDWQGPIREVYLVWPHKHSLSARARVLQSELIRFLQQQSWFSSL